MITKLNKNLVDYLLPCCREFCRLVFIPSINVKIMKESRGNYIILREDGIVARLFNNTVERIARFQTLNQIKFLLLIYKSINIDNASLIDVGCAYGYNKIGLKDELNLIKWMVDHRIELTSCRLYNYFIDLVLPLTDFPKTIVGTSAQLHRLKNHILKRTTVFEKIQVVRTFINFPINYNELRHINEILSFPTKCLDTVVPFHLFNFIDLPKMEHLASISCGMETLDHKMENVEEIYEKVINKIKKAAPNLRLIAFAFSHSGETETALCDIQNAFLEKMKTVYKIMEIFAKHDLALEIELFSLHFKAPMNSLGDGVPNLVDGQQFIYKDKPYSWYHQIINYLNEISEVSFFASPRDEPNERIFSTVFAIAQP